MGVELIGTPLFYDTALKGYYRMESGNLITDSSSNGKTLINNNIMGETTGVFGGATDSGASNTNKDLTRADNFGITGGIVTLNCWFNSYAATYATDHASIVMVNDSSTNTGYNIFIKDTGVSGARLKELTSWDAVTETAISTSTWYMATLTYDTTNVNFYLNGISKGTTPSSGNGGGSLTNKFCICSKGSSVFMSAKIDDVAIFNRVLTATEISNLYNNTFPKRGFIPFL